MICAYHRRLAGQGRWIFLTSNPNVLHNAIAVILTQNASGEAAAVACPDDQTPPVDFQDGNGPGKVHYYITAQYRNFLRNSVVPPP